MNNISKNVLQLINDNFYFICVFPIFTVTFLMLEHQFNKNLE